MVRIGGLASGMDIDTLVKDLMKAERMPLDKLKQKKQILEWQRDDYRSMNILLQDFRNELSTTGMGHTQKYRARTTTSSDETKVTATATSAAAQASYSITEVTSLASAANRVTTEISGATKINPAEALAIQSNNLSTALAWQIGAVGSKTLVGNGTASLSLGLVSNADADLTEKVLIDTAQLDKMSVKVNGVAYKVVGVAPVAGSNEVQIKDDGSLDFGGAIASGATVKVDYLTDREVQTGTLAQGAMAFQLEKKHIDLPKDANGAVLVPVATSDFKLNVGGTNYTIESVNATTNVATLSGSLGELNLTTGEIKFASAQAAGAIIVAYKQKFADLSIKSETSKGTVQEKFLIQSSESLSQVINRVNASNAGVVMMYDSVKDKISLTRKETGNYSAAGANEMTISGNLGTALKLDTSVETDGTNATFVINGLSTERTTNTFVMDNVTITLKKTFAAADGAATVSVNNDGNAVFDNIKAFVEKYNTLIGAISKKTSEEKYRSYTPLTDEQREQLNDKQQEQWEEKARSGLLRRDSILSGALTIMRTNFSQPVSNSQIDPMYKQLASIGITTTKNYREGGKLEINEAKLKEAINNNPGAVEALFIGGAGSTATIGEQGIIHRLDDSVKAAMDKLRDRAGNATTTNQQFLLGRQLLNVDSSIDRFDDRLIQVEDRYWRQFTAMEKAIQNANSQSMYLMQQFSM
ncbi:flagellar filament capping protein FliD [Domibacillus epiphyticus]|uniref:Flagellar hook-associated protein 2 n=1 Tax=Domibacillus epiphyticus TaxID=1714355 RepID=A0A1V2A452_9BACI|nr:flagellar filament capping protein FliD [Domibacillus epiphyticus]OMP65778.1 flagellar hook protein [Domibacillus epiphyticus]